MKSLDVIIIEIIWFIGLYKSVHAEANGYTHRKTSANKLLLSLIHTNSKKKAGRSKSIYLYRTMSWKLFGIYTHGKLVRFEGTKYPRQCWRNNDNATRNSSFNSILVIKWYIIVPVKVFRTITHIIARDVLYTHGMSTLRVV